MIGSTWAFSGSCIIVALIDCEPGLGSPDSGQVSLCDRPRRLSEALVGVRADKAGREKGLSKLNVSMVLVEGSCQPKRL